VGEAPRAGRAGGDGGEAEGAFRRRAAVVRQRAKLGDRDGRASGMRETREGYFLLRFLRVAR
jgi:hypothetical protein